MRMQVIPAIDLIEGKCVRLTEGKFETKRIYDVDPIDMAKEYEAMGIKKLHLVDLDGARSGQIQNLGVLERIAKQTMLSVDFGGGIKDESDIKAVLEAGAVQVNIGTAALSHKNDFFRWLSDFGAEKIIFSADVRDGRIAVRGWQEDSGQDLETVLDEYIPQGLQFVTCTDISRDGKLEGPSLSLYKNLVKTFPSCKIIASGGVTDLDDLTALLECGCHGAILGKAIYEKRISLEELSKWMRDVD